MGRPWWYDSYWQKDKKPKRGFQAPRRPGWAWMAVLLLSLLLTAGGSIGFQYSMVGWFLGFVSHLCNILVYAVFFRAIISWFTTNRNNILVVLLGQLTEPILTPLRRVVPRLGMFDITPMVAIGILWVIPLLLPRLLSFLLI